MVTGIYIYTLYEIEYMPNKELRSSQFPNHFQVESLELVNGLVSLTSSAFYLIDPNMQQKGIVLQGVDEKSDQAYRTHYKNFDLSHPSRFVNRSESVVCLEDLYREQTLHQSKYYKGFLQPMNIEHACDMFFRCDGIIIAVLTMMRDVTLPKFSKDEIEELKKIQKFLEYAINLIYLPDRISQRESISKNYGLTDRELDVLEWVMAGAENKIVAKELSISLATVKTHLIHIFTKLDVNSRAKLLAKIFSELNSDGTL